MSKDKILRDTCQYFFSSQYFGTECFVVAQKSFPLSFMLFTDFYRCKHVQLHCARLFQRQERKLSLLRIRIEMTLWSGYKKINFIHTSNGFFFQNKISVRFFHDPQHWLFLRNAIVCKTEFNPSFELHWHRQFLRLISNNTQNLQAGNCHACKYSNQ